MRAAWIELNGKRVAGPPPDSTRLLDWLRDTAGITSAKEGCGEGHCGACTVLVDGRPVLSCCTLAAAAGGAAVCTAEGLAATPLGERLVTALADRRAFQCGYCAPGMFVAAYGLLAGGIPATADEVRQALSGNVCRCTGYGPIVNAVVEAGGACP
jgi:aerobic carbon-monoxide dehydrogenase small subunit